MRLAVSGLSLLCLALAGCGYRMGSSAEPSFRTLTIEAVKNDSYAPQLQAEIHRQVFDRLSAEDGFRVVNDGGAVRLRVVLDEYGRSVGAVNSQDTGRAASHRFSLSAKVTLVDSRSGKILMRDRQVRADLSAYTLTGLNRTETQTQALLTRELARAIRDAVADVW